jgi:hypothetical protein
LLVGDAIKFDIKAEIAPFGFIGLPPWQGVEAGL